MIDHFGAFRCFGAPSNHFGEQSFWWVGFSKNTADHFGDLCAKRLIFLAYCMWVWNGFLQYMMLYSRLWFTLWIFAPSYEMSGERYRIHCPVLYLRIPNYSGYDPAFNLRHDMWLHRTIFKQQPEIKSGALRSFEIRYWHYSVHRKPVPYTVTTPDLSPTYCGARSITITYNREF